MSKDFLKKTFEEINMKTYSWNLYFFKIDRRNKNPYYVYKHTFRNPDYLPNYLINLRDMILKYQINPLESVQNYDGRNSKTSCDKLCIKDPLIAEQWGYMVSSVGEAPREMIKGKYQGYILDGQPITDGLPSIIIFKVGNPIINLDKKNSKVFKHTSDGELDIITDELCRLYLVSDFIIINDILYSFNLKFEEILGMQKTFARIKKSAIEQIMETDAFCDSKQVQGFLNGYTAPKTFLTLHEQNVSKLRTFEGRKEISDRLHLRIERGKIVITEQDEIKRLIKYLCHKIIHDKETDHLVEVSSIVNDNVLQE